MIQSGLEMFNGVVQQYKDCDIMLMHMGSLIDFKKGHKFPYIEKSVYKDDNGSTRDKCVDLILNKNHPYLPGTIGFINELTNGGSNGPSLILLGEFGEELKGKIRIDISERLKNSFCKNVVPVDLNLAVIREKRGNSKYYFWCVQCQKYHQIEKIRYKNYGLDEALFYICKTCLVTTPEDVIQNRIRYVYENGRTLRIDESESD